MLHSVGGKLVGISQQIITPMCWMEMYDYIKIFCCFYYFIWNIGQLSLLKTPKSIPPTTTSEYISYQNPIVKHNLKQNASARRRPNS